MNHRRPDSSRTAASTFERVADDLAHGAFLQMASALRARTEPILKRWRDLTLKAMPELQGLTLVQFENEIGEILAATADAFESADPLRLRGVMERAPIHGVDRFVQEHSVLDLFEEVRILRGVVIVELAEEMLRPLSGAEAATFHAIFDIIIQQGVIALMGERRRAEEALRESEECYRALFDLGPVAIYSIDSEGVIQNFNRQAASLWGREPALGDTDERFCGSFKLFRPDGTFMPHDQCPMAEVVSGRIAEMRDAEVIIERPDHSRVTVIVNIRPLKNSREEITGAVNCFYDISQRVALENQVKQQAEQLAGESRRKDEFLAMLSHELRNPLAPIRAAVHLMKIQSYDDERPIQRQAREVIERQVGNLTKLVSDLLEVSRFISGRIRLNLQVVDMNQIVHHAMETVRPLMDQRGHTMVFHCCPKPIWTNGDATRLEEVFVNLLNNAAKYTPDGGRIDVWCEHPEGSDYTQLRVRDNGIGIDRELLPRIFELFTQADRSLARSAGGLGVGLSLAHRIVSLHGGSIEAYSPPKTADGTRLGSEFIVNLPTVAAPTGALDAPKQPIAPAAKHDGLKVLLVDDSIDMVTVLASTLRSKGYLVQTAYTGRDGVQVAHRWQPDVVLLDIGLPGMDGYEVARQLRGSNGSGARLIALTGYGKDTDVAEARVAGFDAHLVKPYEFDELERLIAVAVGDHKPEPPESAEPTDRAAAR